MSNPDMYLPGQYPWRARYQSTVAWYWPAARIGIVPPCSRNATFSTRSVSLYWTIRTFSRDVSSLSNSFISRTVPNDDTPAFSTFNPDARASTRARVSSCCTPQPIA